MIRNIPVRFVAFVGLALSILLFSVYLVRSTYFLSSSDPLSLGITVDIIILIPLLYFLAIRKTTIPKITLIPVFFLSTVLASRILPDSHHYYLGFSEYLLMPLELFLIVFVIRKSSKIIKAQRADANASIDFIRSMHQIVQEQIPARTAANAIATEISTFYYAIAGWWTKPEIGQQRGYSYHKKNGYGAILVVILFVALVETFAVHFALHSWKPTVAWIFTGLSIYSLFFILGDYNAARKRPIYLGDQYLHFRLGLRWAVRIPLEEIESIEKIKKTPDAEDNKELLLIGSPNLRITFKSKQTAEGLYGLKRSFKSMSIFVDDKDDFKEQLDIQLQKSA